MTETMQTEKTGQERGLWRKDSVKKDCSTKKMTRNHRKTDKVICAEAEKCAGEGGNCCIFGIGML